MMTLREIINDTTKRVWYNIDLNGHDFGITQDNCLPLLNDYLDEQVDIYDEEDTDYGDEDCAKWCHEIYCNLEIEEELFNKLMQKKKFKDFKAHIKNARFELELVKNRLDRLEQEIKDYEDCFIDK